jgi:hypothetical protein
MPFSLMDAVILLGLFAICIMPLSRMREDKRPGYLLMVAGMGFILLACMIIFRAGSNVVNATTGQTWFALLPARNADIAYLTFPLWIAYWFALIAGFSSCGFGYKLLYPGNKAAPPLQEQPPDSPES